MGTSRARHVERGEDERDRDECNGGASASRERAAGASARREAEHGHRRRQRRQWRANVPVGFQPQHTLCRGLNTEKNKIVSYFDFAHLFLYLVVVWLPSPLPQPCSSTN